jgi:uncharacterized protein YndB with AHSA1/START domain
MNQHANADREIVISRIVDAPREKVWEAWTKEEHLRNWWGPNGFTITTKSFDMREGGEWIFTMHGPDGRDYPNRVVFTKILEPERIDHDHDDNGGEMSFQAYVTFEEHHGKTSVTMRSLFPTAEARDFVVREHGAIEGGKQTLGRLAEYAPTL